MRRGVVLGRGEVMRIVSVGSGAVEGVAAVVAGARAAAMRSA